MIYKNVKGEINMNTKSTQNNIVLLPSLTSAKHLSYAAHCLIPTHYVFVVDKLLKHCLYIVYLYI